MGDPARQASLFATAVPYGPTAKGANEMLRPDQLAVSPSAPILPTWRTHCQVDEQFWRENGERLGQRFDAWLAH